MDVSLVLPNQLFRESSALDRERTVIFYEEALYYGQDERYPCRMHRQKLLLLLAAGEHYRNALIEDEFSVEVQGDWKSVQSSFFRMLTAPSGTTIHVCDPVDDLILRRLKRWAEALNCELKVYESPNFLTNLTWAEEVLAPLKKPLMSSFYSAQRRRLNVLVDEGGKPVGGKWSFDTENRKKLPKTIVIPELPVVHNDECLQRARLEIERSGYGLGLLQTAHYPVTRADALEWLYRFLEERFCLFGDYEDAISREHMTQFHSLLTPMLNLGLLSPQEVLDHALKAANEYDVPLNSLEGFIRQIIGWREYMRVMYVRHGVEMRTSNHWGFTRRMPDCFYDGTTGIEPIDHVILQLLDTGYCHHIERLMVLGNFMLLCRIHPDDVYKWFMEFFVDSYDWVMVPNVYGMSQFADGGIFTTKPYLSGSNYILKMSDWKKGKWCQIWDALFWTFMNDHREFFDAQPRMGMLTRQIDKRKEKGTWRILEETASEFFRNLE